MVLVLGSCLCNETVNLLEGPISPPSVPSVPRVWGILMFGVRGHVIFALFPRRRGSWEWALLTPHPNGKVVGRGWKMLIPVNLGPWNPYECELTAMKRECFLMVQLFYKATMKANLAKIW